jgi:hypothetical protein
MDRDSVRLFGPAGKGDTMLRRVTRQICMAGALGLRPPAAEIRSIRLKKIRNIHQNLNSPVFGGVDAERIWDNCTSVAVQKTE